MGLILAGFQYFLIGFQSFLFLVKELSFFQYGMIFLFFIGIFLFFRRLSIVRHSGGKFFMPYHIAKENFYIHSALTPGKRIIPIKEITSITFRRIRGIKMSGARYFITLERRKGKEKTFMIGENKKTKKLIEHTKKELKQHRHKIKIHEFNN